MRVKFNDNYIVDYGSAVVVIKLIKEDEKWYITVDPMDGPLVSFKSHKFLVGKNGDTILNKEWQVLERVEKIAGNEIGYAFLNGFLDLSDYEEVT